MLDNWAPVLERVRNLGLGWGIAAILPDRDTLDQIDTDDPIHRMTDRLVDATFAPLIDGGWVVADGLLAAVGLTVPRRIASFIDRAIGRSSRIKSLVLRLLRTPTQRGRLSAPELAAGPGSRVLYDVLSHRKERVAALLECLGDTPRFSQNHGIIPITAIDPGDPPRDPENIRGVFCYGPDEIDTYAREFRVSREQITPVGIVRHEEAWVRKVRAESAELHELPFPEFIFVVSRPAGSSYLPRDRKVAALRAIHQVAWKEHGLPLVLRTHPKEADDGTLAEALSPEGEGASWARSRAHPFHLAERASIAVTFFSGVAVDLVELGVPVIEFLDIRGLASHDHTDGPLDSRGRPEFGPYRRDGVVIPADDIEDLRGAFSLIAADRTMAVERLQAGVRRIYPPSPGSLRRMVEAITA